MVVKRLYAVNGVRETDRRTLAAAGAAGVIQRDMVGLQANRLFRTDTPTGTTQVAQVDVKINRVLINESDSVTQRAATRWHRPAVSVVRHSQPLATPGIHRIRRWLRQPPYRLLECAEHKIKFGNRPQPPFIRRIQLNGPNAVVKMPHQQLVNAGWLGAERRGQAILMPVTFNRVDIFQGVGWAGKQAAPALIALGFINNDVVFSQGDGSQWAGVNTGPTGVFLDLPANA